MDEIERSLASKYFEWFVRVFWSTVSEEELHWNWHIPFLCNELQTVAEQVFQRKPKLYDLIINIPPGTTKSTICTIMFPVWCWVRDASLKFIAGSYSSDLSLEHADKSRDIVRSEKFQRLFPWIQIRSDKDMKSHFENTAGGSRFTTSVGGTGTGMHAHIILVDDPLNTKQALAETRRQVKMANDWISKTMSTRKVDKRITPLILIMQRLVEGDPSEDQLKKKKNIRHICLPGKVSEKVYPPELKEKYIDGLLDPVRHDEAVLEEMRLELGFAYSAQVMQDPVPEGGSLFKTEGFRIVDTYDMSKVVMSVRFWDKAGTEGGGKRTAGVLMHKMRSEDGSHKFLISDVVKGHWGAGNREKTIEQIAGIDGKRVYVGVEQEPGSGGKESAENSIKKTLLGFRAFAERPTGDKESRAEPYAAQVEWGNVFLLQGDWNQEFIDEHKTFPHGLYSDQVDAAAGSFNKLNKNVKKFGKWF